MISKKYYGEAGYNNMIAQKTRGRLFINGVYKVLE